MSHRLDKVLSALFCLALGALPLAACHPAPAGPRALRCAADPPPPPPPTLNPNTRRA